MIAAEGIEGLTARTRHVGAPRAWALVLAAALGAGACGERRDAADLAVGVQPFEQLRGVNVAPLRSGVVRAMRRNAEPAPLEGLRESIGAWDVLYAMTGYDGTDGSWPAEEALVLFIEATRAWPSDSTAAGAWRSAIREIQAGMGAAPTCATISGPGFTMRIAEWEHRNGWAVTTTFAPGDAATAPPTEAMHSIAVRRATLTSELPREGAENPESKATWTPSSCATTDAAAQAADPTTKKTT